MKDREVITRLLQKVAARMRVARLLHEIGFALCVVLCALAAFELLRIPLAGVLNDAYLFLLVAALVVFCLVVLGRALKRVSMAQAAGLVDSRLPLHDELKSAYWFVSRPEAAGEGEAAFVRTHVENAARTAQEVRSPRVVPLRLPRSLVLAVIPALVLVGAMWGNPHLVRARMAPAESAADLATDAQSARELLSAKASDEEAIRELDRALATFENSEASQQQRALAAIQARDAVDKVNMKASVTREGLARLARAMKGTPGMEDVAEALEQGRTEDAIAMLEEMRDELPNAPGEDAGAQQNDSALATRNELPLGQDLGDLARDLTNTNGRMDEGAITRLLENLEQAKDTMQTQQRANAARRTMDAMDQMIGMTAQQSQLAPSDAGTQGETPMGTPSPDSGSSDMRGATMFRQASLAPGEEAQDDTGSTTGAPGGHSAARALEGRATKRLDAVLKLERVKVDGGDDGKQEDGKESGWFYSASEQEQAESSFADVRGREDYADANVMRPGHVPIQQKQAVRDYFINLHESNKE